MKDSFDQHEAQTPSLATGARQAAHRFGSAMSSSRYEMAARVVRAVAATPRRRIEKLSEAGVDPGSMISRLAPGRARLKRALRRRLE